MQLSPPRGGRLEVAGTLEVHTAGAEMNVAVGLARLGHRSAFVSRVGADPFGARIVNELRGAGVDVSNVREDPHRPTGIYVKDYDGARTSMYYYREGSAAAGMSSTDVPSLPVGPRWFHVTGITAALSPTCAALLDDLLAPRPDRVAVSFDVNYRPSLWSATQAAPALLGFARRADLVFVGRDEASALWGAGDADDVWRLLPDVPRLVVKDAAVGATSIRGDDFVTVPSLRVPVVEPVGAGDAFAAGYLSATLDAADERTALRGGHLFAAGALLTVADQVEPPPPELLTAAGRHDDSWWENTALLEHPYLRGQHGLSSAVDRRSAAGRGVGAGVSSEAHRLVRRQDV